MKNLTWREIYDSCINDDDSPTITYSINGSIDCDDILFDEICEEAADRFPDQLNQKSPYWEFSYCLDSGAIYSASLGRIM